MNPLRIRYSIHRMANIKLRKLVSVVSAMLASAAFANSPDSAQERAALPLPRGLSDTVARIQYNSRLPAPPGAPVGKRRHALERMRILVIPVRTPESEVEPISTDQLKSTFFGDLLSNSSGTNASVADYFKSASYGSVTQVTGEVLPWIQLDYGVADYFPPGKDFPFRHFFEDVFTKADPVVNYAEFDDDKVEGDRSGARNDGFVDIVVVITDCGPGSFNAYRWKMTLLNTPDSPPWSSQDDETLSVPGVATSDTVKVKIDDFVILPWHFLKDGRVGVAAHEILHFLGLPDLYNRNGWDIGGVGQWCIMCLGCKEIEQKENLVMLGESAKFPPLPSAWCRAQLGWGVEVLPGDDGSAMLEPTRETGDYVVLKSPNGGQAYDELIYVEYYTPPTAQSPWGKGVLPETQSGFVVWHADHAVGRSVSRQFVWPSADLQRGQNDASFTWPVRSRRPLLRLVQADGQLDIEKAQKPTRYNDPADLFGGGALNLNQGDAGFTWYAQGFGPDEIRFDPSKRQVLYAASAVEYAAAPAASPINAPSPADSSPVAAPKIGRKVGSPVAPTSRVTVPRQPPLTNQAEIKALRKLEAFRQALVASDKENQRVLAREDLPQLSKVIALQGGAEGDFAQDVEKVITSAANEAPAQPSPASSDLGRVSFPAMQQAAMVLDEPTASAVTKAWEQARTRPVAENESARKFYETYGPDQARTAKVILSPDRSSVVRLSVDDLALKGLADSTEADVLLRLPAIKGLSGIKNPDVTLQVLGETAPAPHEESGSKLKLSYIADVGGQKIPINTGQYWVEVSYNKDLELKNITFAEPLKINNLPKEAKPKLSGAEVVESVRKQLGRLAPPATDIQQRLELIQEPSDKTSGNLVLGYRLDLPLPSGRTQAIYVDASTGERIE